MIAQAAFTGLTYGIIAAFTAFGFILTAAILYVLINALDKLHDYASGATREQPKGGRGRDT